ncbi:putative uncharacterized protein DDB_G0290989 [Drosophila albomicans]|uniref:Uncharacterized protein n=1 Tax=Drosophila albomicans TaxID=7291 RepID=A0A9C6SZP5_DROAB|nr:putative uncharacterized protein DDB_G0290989 [Drosophila albomicans]
MSGLVRFLLFSALCATLAHGQDTTEVSNDDSATEAARGLASSYDPEDKQLLKKNSHIYMGIYKNYKSTYLGNKTTNEYRKRLRNRVSAAQLATNEATATEAVEQEQEQQEQEQQQQQEEQAIDDALAQELRNEANAEALMEAQTDTAIYDDNETGSGKKRRKRKRKNRNNNKRGEDNTEQPERDGEDIADIQQYHVGPGLNVSLDMSNDIVRVKLDGENLKEIVSAHWLSTDNSEEGRGKKYDMITKVLPLFILPFLIQSAIVPFLVTKLKLLLVKSILVGKLAIFLLIISAIKNSNKMMQSYEVAPSYWASEPSRRSELAAAASSAAAAAYNGYRVEGKPTTWVN